MIRDFIKRIKPYLIPELKKLLIIMIIAIPLTCLFATWIAYRYFEPPRIYVYGFIFSVIGLYVSRFTAFGLKKTIGDSDVLIKDRK